MAATPKGNHKATGKVGSFGRAIGTNRGKGARGTGGPGTNAKSIPGGPKGSRSKK